MKESYCWPSLADCWLFISVGIVVNQTFSLQSRKPCLGHCHKKWLVKLFWWTANYANSKWKQLILFNKAVFIEWNPHLIHIYSWNWEKILSLLMPIFKYPEQLHGEGTFKWQIVSVKQNDSRWSHQFKSRLNALWLPFSLNRHQIPWATVITRQAEDNIKRNCPSYGHKNVSSLGSLERFDLHQKTGKACDGMRAQSLVLWHTHKDPYLGPFLHLK